jgi:hypothetical protein
MERRRKVSYLSGMKLVAQRSPSARLLRFLIACFVVGIALSFAGITTAGDILGGLWDAAMAVLGLLYANADWILRLVALGAIVMVPLWLAARLIDLILSGIGRLFRRRPRAAEPEPVRVAAEPTRQARRPRTQRQAPPPRRDERMREDRRREDRMREEWWREHWPPSPTRRGPPPGYGSWGG